MKTYFGKYAGTVYDNNDPDKTGRIKAIVPGAGFAEFATSWARPCFPFPGIWTPTVGDKVWIEFEAGDPNAPIWTGVFYGAPGGQSDGPQGATVSTDLVIEVLTNILAKATNNWEEQAVQRIIEAATIKLGKTAVEGLIKESFGTNKYNTHTHNVTAIGSPTGPPIPPTSLFVPTTDATQKVKGE